METLYTIELMILIGVLLPLVAIKAREIFVFTMVLFGTGFFATYIAQSLGTFQSLTILDPPFVLAGCLLGWLAVRFMDYVMIVSTSLIGAFLLMLAVSGISFLASCIFNLSKFSLALGAPGSPLFHSQWWLLLTAFVGINLLQSGVTRWCPAEFVVRKLGAKPGA